MNEAEDTAGSSDIEVTFEYATSPNISVVDQDVQESEPEIAELQQQCDDFRDIYRYLQDQSLPDYEKCAKYVVTGANQYVLKDGTLYHVFQPRSSHNAVNDFDRLILQLALPNAK